MPRSKLTRSWLLLGLVTLLVGTFERHGSADDADEWSRLAYSRDAGVEVMVRLRNGAWCEQALQLRLIAERRSVFTSDKIQTLIESLSEFVRKDCPLVRYFAISGMEKGSSAEIYRAEAAFTNDWYIVELSPAAGGTERKARAPDAPPMTPEQRKRVERLQSLVREAAKAKTESGKTVKIQLVLRKLGFYKGSPNGEMSAATQNAIKEFKKFHGLPVTANIDNDFLEVLHDPRALLGQKYVKPTPSRS